MFLTFGSDKSFLKEKTFFVTMILWFGEISIKKTGFMSEHEPSDTKKFAEN